MYSKEQAIEKVSSNIGSIEALCKEAVCTADINLMLALGFPEEASRSICETIREEASNVGIENLEAHYRNSIVFGKSNVIGTIIRKKHQFYFATRSNLHPLSMLNHVEREGFDICEALFRRSIKATLAAKQSRRDTRNKTGTFGVFVNDSVDAWFGVDRSRQETDNGE